MNVSYINNSSSDLKSRNVKLSHQMVRQNIDFFLLILTHLLVYCFHVTSGLVG